jgi:sulfate permease, SulP family
VSVPSAQPSALPPDLRPFSGDLRAGVAVATMTLVTAVSYATVAAAPLGLSMSAAAALSGLIGAALGGAVAALMGSVPEQMFSPRASVAVVIASALATLDVASQPALALLWLTACLLLAGALQCAFAVLRLGGIIRLIPHSVTAGLTVGIAADMAWSQLPHWLGASGLHGMAQAAPLVVGLATVATIAWAQWQGWNGWALPLGVAFGVLANAALGAVWHVDALPHLQALDWQATPLLSVAALMESLRAGVALPHLPSLAGYAVAIALVNSVETLTSSVLLEELAQRRFDANKALLTGAVASVASVLAGGLPVAGSAAASMVSVKAGARSHWAPLLAAAVLLVLAAISASWLSLVPLAVVAGLMLTVAFALARAPLKELLAQRNRGATSRRFSAELVLAGLVCALVLTIGIVGAVFGGVLAAAMLLVAQMRRTLVRRHYDAGHPDAVAHIDFLFEPRLNRRIRIVEVAQPLFFATAEAVVQAMERLQKGTRCTILDLRHVGAIDATAARVLTRYGAALRLRRRELLLVISEGAPALDPAADVGSACRVLASLNQALREAARLCGNGRAGASFEDPVARPARSVVPLHSVATERRPALDPKAVDRAGHELALLLGPVAAVLTQRAAAQCTDIATLYNTLALELHSAADRDAFLGLAPTTTTTTKAHTVARTSPVASSVTSLVTPLSPTRATSHYLGGAEFNRVLRELSPLLGPIAKLLIERAQHRARSREHLYHLLAQQLGSAAQRDAFLSAAGVSLLAPQDEEQDPPPPNDARRASGASGSSSP